MTDNLYQKHWDHFVESHRTEEGALPGDEWGNPESWEKVFSNLFVNRGAVSTWQRTIEIGAGSGKYTVKVLRSSNAEILAADVSPRFQEVMCQNLRDQGLDSRVEPVIIENRASYLLDRIDKKGWLGRVDAVYSIDAMVHVDIQHLIVYLMTASICLKPGGKLIMTLADCTTERGFNKMLREASNCFARQGLHTGKFEYISPDIVESILPKIGFDIVFSNYRVNANRRDISLVAERRGDFDSAQLLEYL
ncbi:MAG: methyltransferase domain-containing protein [Haliea sp.]|jgi:precorrin-6B methylase 2|nr:methyltransferase domain-containing protein [Haliea sp.]